MALERKRWMLIDDAAPDVSYSGDWFVDTYARPGPFQFRGCATGGTAHGTNTAGGFAFSFEGTELIVRGQANVIPASTNSMLRCTIDGVEGESEVVTSGNLRSWKMCGRSSLSEGRHQVVVNITAGPNTVLWMDEIYYYSLNRPNLRRQWSMLYPNTEEFRYTGVSWSNPFDEGGNHGRESYQNGAKATIPFYGASVELASYLTSSMPRVAGAGTYSLDGGPAVRFEMPVWTPSFRGLGTNDSMFRQTIFTTPPASPGHHTLEVINLGNASTVPLSIDYFLVHHGDVDATTATVSKPNTNTNTGVSGPPVKSSNPSGLSSDSPPSPGGQKNNTGIIVGAVVGVLVLVAAAVALFFWIRKRRQAQAQPPPSQWSLDESVALTMHPRGIPLGASPYRDAPDHGVFSPPDYNESEHGFATTSQPSVMHYQTVPQQTAVHYQTVPQQTFATQYQPVPQQTAMYYETAPQQMVMGYSAVPEQTQTYPQMTPFTHANATPAASPPLRRLPPEKFRLATSPSIESASDATSPSSSARAAPSSTSSTYNHTESSQSPATNARRLPPQLPPTERLTDSPASRSSSLHSKARSTRAVPPRVPPPPPRRLPPKIPPARAVSSSEPPLYHE